MLKLLFCSTVLIPCAILAFFVGSETPMPDMKTTGFDEYFLEPAFDKLENCQTTELGVFFYDGLMTSHSAEYITEAVNLSARCDSVEYEITPVLPKLDRRKDSAVDLLDDHTSELTQMLEAHDLDSKVIKVSTKKKFDSLSGNGQTAILKIIVDNPQGNPTPSLAR